LALLLCVKCIWQWSMTSFRHLCVKFTEIHLRTFVVGKSRSLRSRLDFLPTPVARKVGMCNPRRRKSEHGLVCLLCRPKSLYFAPHDFRLQRKHGYAVPISVDRIGFRSPVLYFARSLTFDKFYTNLTKAGHAPLPPSKSYYKNTG